MLYYNIVDFHIVGNESPRQALERSVCPSLLSNTSVILLEGRQAFSLCGAAIRYRPNGEYVSCLSAACREPPGYRRLTHQGNSVIYRCREIEHPSSVPQYQTLPLVQSDDSRTVVGTLNDRCRYILTRSAVLLPLCSIHPHPLQQAFV